MATVREGTRMPQSFKNAWRWLVGASAAAILIASIPLAANADDGIITLCIARNGKIVGIDIACQPHNLQLTWNIPGAAGVPGVQGPTGPQGVTGPGGLTGATGNIGLAGATGPTGAMGAVGLTGSQGGVGAIGPTGPLGSTGLTGPEGVEGKVGPTGPSGNTGPTGLVGPVGGTGVAGTDGSDGDSGDQTTTLTGGTMGTEVGFNAGIQLTDLLLSPPSLWMGPSNGADFIQSTVAVPTPGGCAFDLQVSLDFAPGIASGYIFFVCDGANCDTGLYCIIADTETECADDFDEAFYSPGDTLSILALNWTGIPITLDASWSLDYGYAPSGC